MDHPEGASLDRVDRDSISTPRASGSSGGAQSVRDGGLAGDARARDALGLSGLAVRGAMRKPHRQEHRPSARRAMPSSASHVFSDAGLWLPDTGGRQTSCAGLLISSRSEIYTRCIASRLLRGSRCRCAARLKAKIGSRSETGDAPWLRTGLRWHDLKRQWIDRFLRPHGLKFHLAGHGTARSSPTHW